jgi:PAS domain S-box-containing protein
LRTVSVAFESKDPILITDAQANILRANKMFLKISGYSPEELIGKNTRFLKTDRYGDDYYKRMWDQLLRNGSWAGETRIRDKQGNDFAIGMVITAVKNDRKETTHYVAIYDI